jgi:NAD(P)-dependent dehydrogenase (short-subunit alcohol dehydrogenase family)
MVAGRTSAKIDAVAKEIHSCGGTATPIVSDTLNSADVAGVFDAAEKTGGVPDLAIYNAGNNQMRPLLEMDDAFFEEVWRLCCFGGFLFGREAAAAWSPPEVERCCSLAPLRRFARVHRSRHLHRRRPLCERWLTGWPANSVPRTCMWVM